MNEAQSLQELLKQLLTEQGLQQVLDETRVPELWTKYIGELAAKSTRVVRFENGQLLVECTSSVWRMELRLRAEGIRERINEDIGKNIVREIFIR